MAWVPPPFPPSGGKEAASLSRALLSRAGAGDALLSSFDARMVSEDAADKAEAEDEAEAAGFRPSYELARELDSISAKRAVLLADLQVDGWVWGGGRRGYGSRTGEAGRFRCYI